MNIENQVLKAGAEKVESLVLAENAIQLSSSAFDSIDEFNAAWVKTLTLATKTEIKYDAIKSIAKEEGESEVSIKYKGLAGIMSSVKLKFPIASELDAFYDYFQSKKGFVRTDEALSPIKSALPYLGGLALTLFIATYAFFQASSMEAGTYVSDTSGSRSARKGEFINSIIGMLGSTGVILLGLGVSAYIGYMIWTRFKNPPIQTLLVPGK
jgi:hypothetical protein